MHAQLGQMDEATGMATHKRGDGIQIVSIFFNIPGLLGLHPYPTVSICSTVVKSLPREFLNHTGTPKQGSTITVVSAHISDNSYTYN